MRSVLDHRRSVLELVTPTPVISIPLAEALGLALGSETRAQMDLPPFDNSAMDGYAIHCADSDPAPRSLPVVLDLAAGSDGSQRLPDSAAALIMTGAPIPPGADAVIAVEATDGGTDRVVLTKSVAAGSFIRRRGSDCRVGDVVLTPGSELDQRRTGLLAAMGVRDIAVHRRVRVGVLSTGSELAAPGAVLARGQIHDANGPLLAAAIRLAGAQAVIGASVHDDREAATAALSQLAGSVDLIVTSGGVSAGNYEVIKDVFAGSNEVRFVKVAMQPGMPQGYGHFQGTPIVCLPGNPVSVFVSFEQFVRPMMRRLGGYAMLDRPRIRATTEAAIVGDPTKNLLLRGLLSPDHSTVRPFIGRGSHLLADLAESNCLIDIPATAATTPAGGAVEVICVGIDR